MSGMESQPTESTFRSTSKRESSLSSTFSLLESKDLQKPILSKNRRRSSTAPSSFQTCSSRQKLHIEALRQEAIRHYGLPDSILSDGGGQESLPVRPGSQIRYTFCTSHWCCDPSHQSSR